MVDISKFSEAFKLRGTVERMETALSEMADKLKVAQLENITLKQTVARQEKEIDKLETYDELCKSIRRLKDEIRRLKIKPDLSKKFSEQLKDSQLKNATLMKRIGTLDRNLDRAHIDIRDRDKIIARQEKVIISQRKEIDALKGSR